MSIKASGKYIRWLAASLILICLLVNGVTLATEPPPDTEDDSEVVSITELPVSIVTESNPIIESTQESELEEDDSMNSTESIEYEELNTSKESEMEYVVYFSEQDVVDIAKLLLRECGGVQSKTEQACVAWCVLNRVDKSGKSIHDVLRERSQFAFYESTDIRDDLYELALDVLTRWNLEKNGEADVGRVLPSDYIYFHGDGVHNYFRNAFDGSYDIWDYSLDSPYDD